MDERHGPRRIGRRGTSVALLGACALVTAAIVGTAGAGLAAGTNLSLGAGADGSSKASGTSYGNVIDGSTSTYWSPSGSTGEIAVKWGSATTVGSVVIREASGGGAVTGWQLLNHDTGATLASGGGAGTIDFAATSLRKIVFRITSASGTPRIAEFETYGSSSGGGGTTTMTSTSTKTTTKTSTKTTTKTTSTSTGSGGGGGTPSTNWPSSAGNAGVNGTISVSGTFDGGMKTYCCIGDGGQSESQDPMFELADGATIQNVIIGSPAGDGIHCKGTCTIRNVWWNDVGEDAATFLQTNGGTSYVIGGGAKSASDKVFQHNGNGTVNISGFYAKSLGKLYRSCGNCSSSYARHVVVDNVILDGAKYVVGINTNFGDTAKLTRITLYNGSSTHVCAEYKGVSKGSEPSYLQDGWNDGKCNVSKSDITYK
jgi:hypothetical protein